MRVISSERWVSCVLSAALFGASFLSGTANSSEGNIKIIASHRTNGYQADNTQVHAGQMRNRRSFLDSLRNTIPGHPDHNQDLVQSGNRHIRDLGHDLYPPSNLGFAHHDFSFDNIVPSNLGSLFNGQQPHVVSADSFNRRFSDDVDNIDFTMLLPSNFDLKTPVSERAKVEADSIMADFLHFLELRASGGLASCLESRK